MNNAAIIGNLTDDPELRFTPTGTAFALFSIADNYKKDDVEKVSFFNAIVWGDQAEHVAESLKKGMRVVAVGRMEQQRWQNDEGENRSRVQFVVVDIGPALRWALASVTPVQQQQTQYPQGAPQMPGTGQAPAGFPQGGTGYGPNEAPF